MKNILEKLDSLFCKYLGFDRQVSTLSTILVKNKDIFISNNESYKRHQHRINWNVFASKNLPHLEEGNKKNLGIAMGKAIAKNLVISFDEILVK